MGFFFRYLSLVCVVFWASSSIGVESTRHGAPDGKCEAALSASSRAISILNHLMSTGEYSVEDFKTLLEDLRESSGTSTTQKSVSGEGLKRTMELAAFRRLLEADGPEAIAKTMEHLARMAVEMQGVGVERNQVEEKSRSLHRRMLFHQVEPGVVSVDYVKKRFMFDHRVSVPVRITKPYWVADFPITRAQWFEVTGESYLPGNGDAPVEKVSPNQVLSFIQALNQWHQSGDPRLRRVVSNAVAGWKFALPTIAQIRKVRANRWDVMNRGEEYVFEEPVDNELSGDGYGFPRWPYRRSHLPAIDPTVRIKKGKLGQEFGVVNIRSGQNFIKGSIPAESNLFSSTESLGFRLVMVQPVGLLERLLTQLRMRGSEEQ